MENWTIRRAVVADADGLGRCLEAAYAEDAARLDDLPAMAEGLAEEIAERLVWVAETGEAIVGGLVLQPSDGFMLLANVAVHPSQRGEGLGKRLLLLAEAEARNCGFGELRLTTHAAMQNTIALYQRSGWLPSGREGNKVRLRKPL